MFLYTKSSRDMPTGCDYYGEMQSSWPLNVIINVFFLHQPQ